MAVVPWLCNSNVGGTADVTGAVVVGGAMVFGTDVGAIVLVPAAVLETTGVTDPVWVMGAFTWLHRFFDRASGERCRRAVGCVQVLLFECCSSW